MDAVRLLEKYEGQVSTIARRLAPRRYESDSLGFDRDDYEAILREKVLDACRKCTTPATEPGYVWAAVSRLGIDLARKRKSGERRDAEFSVVASLESGYFSPGYEVRDLVYQVQAEMSAEDFGLLCLWVACTTRREAWGWVKRLCSYPTFVRRIREIQRRAREILENHGMGAEKMDAKLAQRADELGVAFTNDTTTDELSRMISAREKQEIADSQCFGYAYDAGSSQCPGCGIRDKCLEQIAQVTIGQITAEYGRELTVAELAQELEVPLDTIERALNLSSPARAVSEAPAPPAPIEVPTETVLEERVPDASAEVASVTPRKKQPAKKVVADATPKATKRGKKAAPVVVEVVESDPTRPGPVLPVQAPVDPAEEKSVSPVEVQAPKTAAKPSTKPNGKGLKAAPKSKPKSASVISSPPPQEAKRGRKSATEVQPGWEPKRIWGDHTLLIRWERERARSKAIAKLTPGTKITRAYGGVDHVIQCKHGHYLYNGQKYPTLYSIVMAITGGRVYPMRIGGQPINRPRLMSNWSAPRFFGLQP